ncbi:uncharacterized protein LOC114358685 [Ostrinia furnacalis]|uniref:uncharacterized protein LOC114358685 n=1 Tax=Ostrinia furnacalis TaxID=93504 RepID=UPI001038C2D4|nr:uncharacterized protein LOC114358685 [Ostrinia furnacalis]
MANRGGNPPIIDDQNMKLEFCSVATMVHDQQIVITLKLVPCDYESRVSLTRNVSAVHRLCRDEFTKAGLPQGIRYNVFVYSLMQPFVQIILSTNLPDFARSENVMYARGFHQLSRRCEENVVAQLYETQRVRRDVAEYMSGTGAPLCIEMLLAMLQDTINPPGPSADVNGGLGAMNAVYNPVRLNQPGGSQRRKNGRIHINLPRIDSHPAINVYHRGPLTTLYRSPTSGVCMKRNLLLFRVGDFDNSQYRNTITSFISEGLRYRVLLSRHYHVEQFFADIMLLHKTCARNSVNTVLMFTRLNYREDGFREILNHALANDIVANLTSARDVHQIIAEFTNRRVPPPGKPLYDIKAEYFLAARRQDTVIVVCIDPRKYSLFNPDNLEEYYN